MFAEVYDLYLIVLYAKIKSHVLKAWINSKDQRNLASALLVFRLCLLGIKAGFEGI